MADGVTPPDSASQKRSRREFVLGAAGASAGLALGGAAMAETTGLVIPAPELVTIAIANSDQRFPVRRVYCLGRNYRAHAVEMGDDPDALPPFFFMKPRDSVAPADKGFRYPTETERLGYEMELVAALGTGGSNIAVDDALDCVFGYGVGLDMTKRDLQDIAKERGRPWEASKSFDHSAPVSPLRPVSEVGHPEENRIWLSVNGDVQQDSTTAALRWSIAESISILSRYFELYPGDIILTGTPSGVGLVERGDTIRGGVAGIGEIEVPII